MKTSDIGARIEPGRRLQILNGPIFITGLDIGVSTIGQRPEVLRVELERGVEVLDRPVVIPLGEIDIAARSVGVGVLGIQAQSES